MQNNYSKREIDNFLKHISESLIRIEEQTTRTNGRVNKLEKWRWILTGAVVAVGAMSVPGFKEVATVLAGF